MKWAYDLCGAEPIIKDMVVYDGTTIVMGELLMLHSGDFTVGHGGLITAYADTTCVNDAVDAVGISLETKTTASDPSIATVTDTTAEPCYAKVIINPFAVYRAEAVTAYECAITSWAATHLVVASVDANPDDIGWVYFSNTAGPNFGELRLITDVIADDSVNTDSAPAATATTADKCIFARGPGAYSDGLDPTATGICKVSSGTAIAAATNIRVVESYIDSDQGFEILRQHKHKATTRKKHASKPAKLYQDIMMKDHAYGVQE